MILFLCKVITKALQAFCGTFPLQNEVLLSDFLKFVYFVVKKGENLFEQPQMD